MGTRLAPQARVLLVLEDMPVKSTQLLVTAALVGMLLRALAGNPVSLALQVTTVQVDRLSMQSQ